MSWEVNETAIFFPPVSFSSKKLQVYIQFKQIQAFTQKALFFWSYNNIGNNNNLDYLLGGKWDYSWIHRKISEAKTNSSDNYIQEIIQVYKFYLQSSV